MEVMVAAIMILITITMTIIIIIIMIIIIIIMIMIIIIIIIIKIIYNNTKKYNSSNNRNIKKETIETKINLLIKQC